MRVLILILLIILAELLGFISYQIINVHKIDGGEESKIEKKYTVLDEYEIGQIYKSNYVYEFDSLLKNFKFINDLDSLKHRYKRYNLYLFWDNKRLIGMCSMTPTNNIILNVILKYFPEFDQKSSFFTNLLKYQPLFIDFVTVSDIKVLSIIKDIIGENNYIIWLDKNCNYDQILIDSSTEKIEISFFIFLCKYSKKMPRENIFNPDKIDQDIQYVDDYILFNSNSVDDYIYKFGLVQFNELNLIFTDYNKFFTSFYYYTTRYYKFKTMLMTDSSNTVGLLCYYNLNESPDIIASFFINKADFDNIISTCNPIYIFNFRVHSNYQRQGRGTKMFNKLQELNPGRSFVLSVDKVNTDAIRLYQKLEFITISNRLLLNNNKFDIMIKKN